MVETNIFVGVGITTGVPIVGSLAINSSKRRVVSVTANSDNTATLSEAYNTATFSNNQNRAA